MRPFSSFFFFLRKSAPSSRRFPIQHLPLLDEIHVGARPESGMTKSLNHQEGLRFITGNAPAIAGAAVGAATPDS